jgi:MFS family permease
MTSDLAILVAGLLGLLLSSTLSGADLDGWGWRIAFLVGAAVVPVGLSLRRRLAETLHESPPMEIDRGPAGVRPYVRVALMGIAMLGSATIGSYTLGYMTTFATHTLHMATSLAFGATVVLGLCGVLLDCVGGWLADRFGRKPPMMASWAFTVVAVLPAFWALSRFRTGWALLGATAILAIPSALGGPAIQVGLTECLPRRIRSGAFATIYALAIMTFGGTTQLIATKLIEVTGNPMSPAWYMAGATAIGLTAMAFVPETKPARRQSTSHADH